MIWTCNPAWVPTEFCVSQKSVCSSYLSAHAEFWTCVSSKCTLGSVRRGPMIWSLSPSNTPPLFRPPVFPLSLSLLLKYSFPSPHRPHCLPPSLHVLTETRFGTRFLDSPTVTDLKKVSEKRPVTLGLSVPLHFFYSLRFNQPWAERGLRGGPRHQTVDAQLHPTELEIRGGASLLRQAGFLWGLWGFVLTTFDS